MGSRGLSAGLVVVALVAYSRVVRPRGGLVHGRGRGEVEVWESLSGGAEAWWATAGSERGGLSAWGCVGEVRSREHRQDRRWTGRRALDGWTDRL